MTKNDKTKTKSRRRDFIKLATAGAPVAAVASLTGAAPTQAATPKTGTRLQKTAHVKKYLETARF